MRVCTYQSCLQAFTGLLRLPLAQFDANEQEAFRVWFNEHFGRLWSRFDFPFVTAAVEVAVQPEGKVTRSERVDKGVWAADVQGVFRCNPLATNGGRLVWTENEGDLYIRDASLRQGGTAWLWVKRWAQDFSGVPWMADATYLLGDQVLYQGEFFQRIAGCGIGFSGLGRLEMDASKYPPGGSAEWCWLAVPYDFRSPVVKACYAERLKAVASKPDAVAAAEFSAESAMEDLGMGLERRQQQDGLRLGLPVAV